MDTWQRSFVLHKQAYKETSLLLDVFTEHHGKIKLLAKGARNKNSKLKSILQPFTPLIMRWLGQNELLILTHAEALSIAIPLQNTNLYSTMYINEILSRTLEPATEYRNLFKHYLHCLTSLAETNCIIEPILRNFEFNLYESLGYAINFNYCIQQNKIQADAYYQYIAEEGFLQIEPPRTFSSEDLYTGEQIIAFAQRDFSTPVLQNAAKRFIRMIFKPLLGNKPLKSRDLFMK